LAIDRFSDHVKAMLLNANIRGDISIERLPGGANNRVFRVKAVKNTYLLKEYYSDSSDNRNRLEREFSFLTYSNLIGIQSTPQPIVADYTNNLGLYEFIEGQSMSLENVNEGVISQAANFFRLLNSSDPNKLGVEMNDASEACFSIRQHLDLIDSRIKRLLHVKPVSDLDAQAVAFIHNLLRPEWRSVQEQVSQMAAHAGICLDHVLSARERCVSPSDFGFHNSILQAGGVIKFVDFEYSGWDDPAKMICDFFCQPKVPVNALFFDTFSQKALSCKESPESIIYRAVILLKAYRIKWTCIMLNEFTANDSGRRRFAGISSEESKRNQLAKAKNYLNEIETTSLN
jgi:thiamine kinase-like enzyme